MEKIQIINESGKIKKGLKLKLSIVLPEYANLNIFECSLRSSFLDISSALEFVINFISNELARKEKVYEPEKIIVISEDPCKTIILKKDEKEDKLLKHKMIIETEHVKRGKKRRKKAYTIIKITDEVDIFAGIFSIFVAIWLKILHELSKRKRRSYLDKTIRKEASIRFEHSSKEEIKKREKAVSDQLQRIREEARHILMFGSASSVPFESSV